MIRQQIIEKPVEEQFGENLVKELIQAKSPQEGVQLSANMFK